MKKSLLILTGCVLAAGLFGGGYALGNTGDELDPELHVSTLTQTIGEASGDWMTVYLLDNGRENEAKSSLNTGLDGFIMAIDQLAQDCPDEEAKAAAKCLLGNIARHREKHPPFYGRNENDKTLVRGNIEVQRILKNALSEGGTACKGCEKFESKKAYNCTDEGTPCALKTKTEVHGTTGVCYRGSCVPQWFRELDIGLDEVCINRRGN
ncbi:MAG: hypothetical protein GY854_09405 [Deltaproteobacteria bacterium]|nr:hypothetical protein [Deltaproteobacteria bacterium]